VRLEPLGPQHAAGLRAAAADGELWKLRITSVPEPQDTEAYIQAALDMRPSRFAFAVIDTAGDTVIGTTSYHDIVPAIHRLEIGYTWYARSRQRTYAFETLECAVVGFRTDNFNYTSQAAIERLGARKDGVLRHHALRRDGTVRDTVMYSITRGEWPEVKAHLRYRLQRG
jgi:RimJ/RimL family protein N-acetyltransferase